MNASDIYFNLIIKDLNEIYYNDRLQLPSGIKPVEPEIINIAKNIASGVETLSPEVLKNYLHSPFNYVKRKESPTGIWTFNIKGIDVINSGFPCENNQTNNPSEQYRNLFQAFENDYNTLINGFQPEYSISTGNTLLFLLQKYFSTVPAIKSPTYKVPLVNLYNHLKISTAFATALWGWAGGKDLGNYDLKNLAEKRPFLLLTGKFSGIQSFIYNIYDNRAKRALKGRNSYLNILAEAIVYKILRKLHIFYANVVLNTGGKIFILLPNTKDTKEKLRELDEEIIKWMWKQHKNELYFSMDLVEFGVYKDGNGIIKKKIILAEADQEYIKQAKTEQFATSESKQRFLERLPSNINGEQFIKEYISNATIGDLWWVANNKLQEHKTKKWKKLFQNIDSNQAEFNFENLFVKAEQGGYAESSQVCAVTGVFAPNNSKPINWDEEDIRVLPEVKLQIDLGEKLENVK